MMNICGWFLFETKINILFGDAFVFDLNKMRKHTCYNFFFDLFICYPIILQLFKTIFGFIIKIF